MKVDFALRLGFCGDAVEWKFQKNFDQSFEKKMF